MADRGLIVNADDFGLSPGVNAGVARTHEQGILTSASLMVRPDAAAAAAAYARATPALGLGLHADLGEWVQRDGDWLPVYEVVSLEGELDAVEAEIQAQLDRFRRLTGREPTHLDSHQHVHRWEPVIALFRRVAAQLEIPLRHDLGGVHYCGDLYGHDEHGDPIPEAVTVDALIDIIRALEPGVTELACHPGIGADTGSAYDVEREQEVEVLCDPRVAAALRREGVTLRSFSDIASAGFGAR
ncbi:MAG: carbohydrate deacetylase [Solirubrobacterales bacterium]